MTVHQMSNVPAAMYFEDGTVTAGQADLEWCIEDPAAVRLTLRAPNGDTTTWLIARWMLMSGMGTRRGVGSGDVVVRKVTDYSMLIHLAGVGDFLFASRILARFLTGCEETCPSGSEAEDDRLAAWIGAYLASAGFAEAGPHPDEEAAAARARYTR